MATFHTQVLTLASSSPDILPPNKRNECVAAVKELLESNEENERKTLAEWNDLKCSSSHSYRRIALLYVFCLAKEDNEPTVQAKLVRQLARILQQSQDVNLVDTCIEQLSTIKDLASIFYYVASQETDLLAAIAVGSALSNDEQIDWIGTVVTSFTTLLPSSTQVQVLKTFLSQNVSEQIWNDTLSPALLLKCKSHPDKALDTTLGVVSCTPNAIPNDQWKTVLIKHIHTNNCKLVGEIMMAWTLIRPAAADILAPGLVQSSPVGPARLVVYNTLTKIAQQCPRDALENITITNVMDGLVELLSKELKAEQRAPGQTALVLWMVLAIRQSIPYDKALETMVRAMTAKGGEAAQIMAIWIANVPADILESIVGHMMKDAKVVKALEQMTENVKKATQVEGLVALYFGLLSSSRSNIPAYVLKIMASSASFVYSQSMLDAVDSNATIGTVLPRTLALYVQSNAKVGGPSVFKSACARALVACVTAPTVHAPDQHATEAIASSVEMILTYEPQAAELMVQTLMERVNQVALDFEALVDSQNATREAREAEKHFDIKGQLSDNASHHGFDANAVRHVARLLCPKCHEPGMLAKVLILMHAGSSLKNDGHQRSALMVNTRRAIETSLLDLDDVSHEKLTQEIVTWSTHATTNGETHVSISNTIHLAASSLIVSFGGIASNFSPDMDDPDDENVKPYMYASKLCIEGVAPRLSERLEIVSEMVEELTERDIGIFSTKTGSLFNFDDNSKKQKKNDGKHLTEDEVWELQIKQELAAKKGSHTDTVEISDEDKKLVAKQDEQRKRIQALVFGDFSRVLDSIRYLCSSDIEVGNQCLPLVSRSVLTTAISVCPAAERVKLVREKSQDTLISLGACVYEIHEMHAPTLAQALMISCRKEKSESPETRLTRSKDLSISPLPSPCAPAACVIFEMDVFNDALSPSSFVFLFPVIQAALMGPRTTTGCEHALRVLQRHTEYLRGREYSPIVAVLRKDMAISVLELLKHDRSQTFQDPSAYEALISIYDSEIADADLNTPVLTAAELAPLLDERGSLGNLNCRKASMMVLTHIVESNPKITKANPLVENRIWLNCFGKDEDVRFHARKAWGVGHGVEEQDVALAPPSPLNAVALMAVLNHPDDLIVEAAAEAYAYAMGMHPSSVGRNIEMLCKAYIDSFPTQNAEEEPSGPARLPSVPTKKTIATGTKKKIAPKKSALDVAGIGQAKAVKKKKSVGAASALLKPREERTLDKEALESQFKIGHVKRTDDGDSPERVRTRLGILHASTALAQCPIDVQISDESLKQLTSFLMAYGIADNNDDVKNSARKALCDILASKGSTKEALAFLLPHLENILKNGLIEEDFLGSLPTEKIPRDVAASDRRREGAVVALGAVAVHLQGPENEHKIDNTVDMLLSALRTPSEDVQASVADALTNLMKKGNTQDRVETILSDLLKDCLHGETLAIRRGAAYGLSAVVKGSGITVLKKHEVVKKLEEACTSGDASSKEGSLFAMELLGSRLGLLFEPYVIVLLPSLLKSFSDSSDHVRKAASHTAGIIMSKLSAHGVKLVLPAVLTAFNDPAWRTKQASIHMLGAMSHLAPKQLASALPKVVPKLTEAFSDTHPKVKSSAQEALNEISTVIKNPEISSISSTLLKALTDPADFTTAALEALIETEFLHAIDAPSLALIVPILHRGLRDRGATNKRFGGLISGNICTMINDPKDFVPYLPLLLPDLQTALLDPIPDVRSTAAKALGSLTRSLGDHILPELRPWLLKKLRDEACSSAERSGAAQGLSEVLIASGSSVVDDALRNEILPLRNYPDASTREGVLWMLSFLPPAMGQGFTPLIDVSLPALISGISDDSEPVRDVAMRAGRVLIRSHGKVQYSQILPSLEIGLGDNDYRIRVASLSLLGDLLSVIGGTQMAKGDGNTQDDVRRAERAQAQIALVLGPETRKGVLSNLYMARSDSVHAVRQSAIQVWKTVVSVTARTLRDILPVLVGKIIDNLASGHEEKTVVAGRCLGDVVSKLGESVLPQIIPVLRNALYTGDEHTKRGVCVGLSEVINCSTKDQILKFIEIIVKLVQDALSDEDSEVRRMAATSFQSLYGVVGSRAFDEVVPSLMVALETGDDNQAKARALNGLTGILRVRSRELLPYIVPRLISKPITINHAKALAGISEVTSETINVHFTAIIPALLRDLSELEDQETEREEALRSACKAICGCVATNGVNTLVSEIASKCGNDKGSMRRESCRMLENVITERAEKQDFYDQVPIILRELLYRLNDDDASVLKANNAALTALSTLVPDDELVNHIEFMRNILASLVSDARRRKGGVGDGEFLLPGFNMPKGLDPLLPIYQRGILYGSPGIREVAAAGLGEVLELTSTKYLAGPLIVKMTGPLLRIVGDRNPSNVKVAILKTLGLILVKGGPALRAFVPQFQTTFVKALSDPSRQVRLEAIEALSLLMPLSTRVDPLIKELVSSSLGKNIPAEGLAAAAIQTATLQALAVVLHKGGTKAQLPTSIPSALDASKELLHSPDDGIREAAARVMGSACALLGREVTMDVLKADILVPGSNNNDDSSTRHGKMCAVRRILSAETDITPSIVPEANRYVTSFLKDDKTLVREAACLALGSVISRSSDPKSIWKQNEKEIMTILQNLKEPMEIHRAMAGGLVIALSSLSAEERISCMGHSILDACLNLALSGSQRVQFAYNDVLWVALDVEHGQDGLDRYGKVAEFENVRSMRSLHSKVLTRIKEVTILKD